jgi:hypothetical protein
MLASSDRLVAPQGRLAVADRQDCPVCGHRDAMPSIERPSIPIFQNVTYATREAALAAARGKFLLATCRRCGFSYNAAFDPQRMVYDESYDNHVASSAFRDYYRSLAGMLIDRFAITDGHVYDIGCGKGEFLEIFHELAPRAQATGIDPSCAPRDKGNFRLIRARFDASLFVSDARLVLLRHVLEHLDEPVAFLKQLRAAMPDAPLFVEVPDLDWILDNNALWDFCYEHCNYFTMASLANACTEAGLAIEAQSRSFGGQYQWIICRSATSPTPRMEAGEALDRVAAYATRESDRIAALTVSAQARGGVALWGMATKGVLLSNILPPGLIRGGIDMNDGKQGRYVGGSAVQIHPPDWLRTRPDCAIWVMNPNYLPEIRQTVRDMAVQADIEAI